MLQLAFLMQIRIKVCPGTIFCQLTRQLLVFFENDKIRWMRHLGWPGGMRRGAGGDYEGVLRSARCDLRMWTSAVGLTCQLLPNGKGGGFNRSAHSAGPGSRDAGQWKKKGEEG